MNLDRKNQENNKNEHKGMMKHGLMMILCCLIPVLLIAVLPLIGFKKVGGLSSLIFLLCPLMHIGMMFMMRKSGKGHSCHENKNADSQQNVE